MLYCEWLYYYYIRFGMICLQAVCCPVVRRRLVSSILAILAPSHDFFTATIYRGISWLWRYWYRHLSIDDKYRGIAGIAQHYLLYGNQTFRTIAFRIVDVLYHWWTFRTMDFLFHPWIFRTIRITDFSRCDQTPHRAHRTTSRRERRVTGRFVPSSVRPIGLIQCFLNVSCLFS